MPRLMIISTSQGSHQEHVPLHEKTGKGKLFIIHPDEGWKNIFILIYFSPTRMGLLSSSFMYKRQAIRDSPEGHCSFLLFDVLDKC